MKTKIALFILLAVGQIGFTQGFVNLNFESAQIKNLTGNQIPAANAFPSWTVNAPYIYYDDLSLSGQSISICDQNSPIFPSQIQGNYYALLTSANVQNGVSISLGQNGTIPLGTESMTFWGNFGGLQISFAGQALTFSETGSTANYNIYKADVSQFAGDSGQLLFSLPPFVGNATLDNIQFSSSPVPEPGELTLMVLGMALLGLRHQIKFTKSEL
ncbi:MAG: hypothetical protein P4N60_19740 [Verrucomicrobiae bacterium]|nr:hypothetical protein [Verrucomicrobiae bacterium]